MIRNYVGFPRGIPGVDLAQRAYEQAWEFVAKFHLMRTVTELEPYGDRHRVGFHDSTFVLGRSVVLATGVTYRRLNVSSVEQFVGDGVFYGAATTEAHAPPRTDWLSESTTGTRVATC